MSHITRPSGKTPATGLVTLVSVLMLSSLPFVTAGCGTYSLLRPADTLPSGRVEISGGVAASSVPEVVPVVQAAIGVTDWLELVGQYEVYSAFAEARLQVLSSTDNGIALALGVGGGAATTLATDTFGSGSEAAATASAVLGRRFANLDLYVGNRTLLLAQAQGYWISSTRAGISIALGEFFRIIAEGGATVHVNVVTVAEGTVAIGTRF